MSQDTKIIEEVWDEFPSIHSRFHCPSFPKFEVKTFTKYLADCGQTVIIYNLEWRDQGG